MAYGKRRVRGPDRLETRHRYLPSGVQRSLANTLRVFERLLLRAPFLLYFCGSRFAPLIVALVYRLSSGRTTRLNAKERETQRVAET